MGPLDQGSSHPGVQHDQLDLNIIGHVGSPDIVFVVVFFNFSREEQLFSNIEQTFLMFSTQTMIRHAFDPDNTSLLQGPGQKIFDDLPVAMLLAAEGFVAEEEEGAREDSSCVVESLNCSSEGDGGACLDCSIGVFVFGEGSGFSLDEVVELVVLEVDEVEADSFIEERLLALVGAEEGRDWFVVESSDGL